MVLPVRKYSSIIVIGLIIFSLISQSFIQAYACECSVEKNCVAKLNATRDLSGCCSKNETAGPQCRKSPTAPGFDPFDDTPVCCCIHKNIQQLFSKSISLKINQTPSYKILKTAAAFHATTRQNLPATSVQLTGDYAQNRPIISPHISTNILLL